MKVCKRSGSRYEITVRSLLDESWTEWLDGLEIRTLDERFGTTTMITGSIEDQSALRGLMGSIWDLNLEIVALRQIETTTKIWEAKHE